MNATSADYPFWDKANNMVFPKAYDVSLDLTVLHDEELGFREQAAEIPALSDSDLDAIEAEWEATAGSDVYYTAAEES